MTDQKYFDWLPNTPGWLDLTDKTREFLQKETAASDDDLRQGTFLALRGCIRLANIQKQIDGTSMSMRSYMAHRFGERNERTGWRWLAVGKKVLDYVPEEAALSLVETITKQLPTAQISTVVYAIEQTEPLKSLQKKDIEPWKANVIEALSRDMADRRSGKRRKKLDLDAAAKILATDMNRTLKEFDSTRERKEIIRTAGGYAMDKLAIPGNVTIERTAIPDEWWPRPGAPKGPRKKKK